MYMKHSSILIYYQAVVFYHKVFGLAAPPLSHPYLKSILSGILNIPGSRAVSKDPFTPELLLDLAKFVSLDLDAHVLCWTGLLIMFRSLLRVSHITDSAHTLTRADVRVQDWGVTLSIRSSKTMKEGEGVVLLPLVISNDSRLCPVFWIKLILRRYPRGPTSPLLSSARLPKFTYSLFTRVFSALRCRAQIVGNYSSHSLRRGGATFMANQGMRLQEIKEKGLWKSNAVQRYIVPSLQSRKQVDKKFSSLLSCFGGLVNKY